MLKEIKETLGSIKQTCAEIRATAGSPDCPLKYLGKDNRFSHIQDLRHVGNPR